MYSDDDDDDDDDNDEEDDCRVVDGFVPFNVFRALKLSVHCVRNRTMTVQRVQRIRHQLSTENQFFVEWSEC